MNLACCTWALSGDDQTILQQIADTGFTTIDIRFQDFREPASIELIDRLGLSVYCMSGSFSIPPETALDHPDEKSRIQAVAAIEETLERAAEIGAAATYVVPGEDASPEALERFTVSITGLADKAAQLGQRMLIEHFPGKALPTVVDTVDYLRRLGHPNLYLLYDIGHAQLSGEDIASSIKEAGDLLGYFHLDDNDGQADLHWALLDGVMSEKSLRNAFDALHYIGYVGPVSLELQWTLPDPLDAIRRSWTILQDVL